MSIQQQLRRPAPTPEYQDLQHQLAELQQQFTEFKDGPPLGSEPVLVAHPLMHLDFWFIIGAMAQVFLVFTSTITSNQFEPLLTGALVCLLGALICNLTREREPMVFRPIIINIHPAWPDFGRRPQRTLREIQMEHLGRE